VKAFLIDKGEKPVPIVASGSPGRATKAFTRVEAFLIDKGENFTSRRHESGYYPERRKNYKETKKPSLF